MILETGDVAGHDDQVALGVFGGLDDFAAHMQMQVTPQGDMVVGLDAMGLGLRLCKGIELLLRLQTYLLINSSPLLTEGQVILPRPSCRALITPISSTKGGSSLEDGVPRTR